MLVQSTNNKAPSFRQNGAFNIMANIESNILLNKGITDIGGFVVPQAVMSNNKDESVERVFKSLLYFVFTFVSPFLLLPLMNKHALNLAVVMGTLGFGLPYALNKLLKRKVSEDKAKQNFEPLVNNGHILSCDSRFSSFRLLDEKHQRNS